MNALPSGCFAGRLLGWSSLLLLSACTTVNVDIPPLQATLPDKFDTVDLGPGHQDPAEIAKWWESLRDPVLTGLIEEGLRNNTDVRIALARIKEARAYHGMAESAYYPTVEAMGGVARGRQTSQVPGQSSLSMPTLPIPLPIPTQIPLPSLNPNTSTPMGNTTAAGLQVTWEIDVFGGRQADAEMVHQFIMGAEEQKHGAQLLVAGDIATRYFEARGAEQRMEALQRGVLVAERAVRYAQGRYKAGHTNMSEVAKAELQLRSVQSQIEPLKALLASHLRRIAVLRGLAPQGAAVAVLPPRPTTARRPPSLPAVLPGDVLERRPDVRGTARRVRAQAAKVGSAKADLLPKFYLGFSNAAGRLHPDNIEGTNFGLQTLGVGVRIPLFNAGRIRSNIAVNQAQLEGVAAEYEQKVLSALEDVDNVYTALKAFQTRHELMVQAAELAKQIAQRKAALFTTGQELLQVSLEADAEALKREDEAIQSDVSLNTYTVLLYKALGGGWSAEDGELSARRP
ncbi:MAG TPA: TolC family protein [Aquabacterium sp.]|uniref:TolC family protein n=1 Tax=Aquabacterium sp. TaxID=1872578 RepID=UPI002E35C57F|nr:TolC family protein [Aquabacterium sp.]HEX5372041.1 TolC family protein [Aquabacterium sp.]